MITTTQAASYTEEQLQNFQFFINEFERNVTPVQDQKPEAQNKIDMDQVIKKNNMIRAKSAKKAVRIDPSAKKSDNKKRSISAGTSKKKEKKKREIPYYKKNKPKQRPDIVYQGKIFKYKTQLVNGPQLACQYNRTWHPEVSCKMYLNLGKNVYKQIGRDNTIIPTLIKNGNILVKNQHSIKEEEYIQKLKDNYEAKRAKRAGPKSLPSDSDDESNDEEDNINPRRQTAKTLEVAKEDEDDYEGDEEKKELEEEEEEYEEEDQETKTGNFKINPVSTLKKEKKTTRSQFEDKASKALQKEQIKTKKDYKKGKKQKNVIKPRGKGNKKQGKKQQKKPQKKAKPIAKTKNMMEEDESSDEDDSEQE